MFKYLNSVFPQKNCLLKKLQNTNINKFNYLYKSSLFDFSKNFYQKRRKIKDYLSEEKHQYKKHLEAKKVRLEMEGEKNYNIVNVNIEKNENNKEEIIEAEKIKESSKKKKKKKMRINKMKYKEANYE